MTPFAKDITARMLVEVVKLPIGERKAALAMLIRVLWPERRVVDAEFSNDLESALRTAGYAPATPKACEAMCVGCRKSGPTEALEFCGTCRSGLADFKPRDLHAEHEAARLKFYDSLRRNEELRAVTYQDLGTWKRYVAFVHELASREAETETEDIIGEAAAIVMGSAEATPHVTNSVGAASYWRRKYEGLIDEHRRNDAQPMPVHHLHTTALCRWCDALYSQGKAAGATEVATWADGLVVGEDMTSKILRIAAKTARGLAAAWSNAATDLTTSGAGEVSRVTSPSEASFPTTTPAGGPEEAGALLIRERASAEYPPTGYQDTSHGPTCPCRTCERVRNRLSPEALEEIERHEILRRGGPNDDEQKLRGDAVARAVRGSATTEGGGDGIQEVQAQSDRGASGIRAGGGPVGPSLGLGGRQGGGEPESGRHDRQEPSEPRGPVAGGGGLLRRELRAGAVETCIACSTGLLSRHWVENAGPYCSRCYEARLLHDKTPASTPRRVNAAGRLDRCPRCRCENQPARATECAACGEELIDTKAAPNACVVCSASLMGPVSTDEPPHCEDCRVTEDMFHDWEEATYDRLTAREPGCRAVPEAARSSSEADDDVTYWRNRVEEVKVECFAIANRRVEAVRLATIEECAAIAQERVSAGFHWTDIPRRIKALATTPFTSDPRGNAAKEGT